MRPGFVPPLILRGFCTTILLRMAVNFAEAHALRAPYQEFARQSNGSLFQHVLQMPDSEDTPTQAAQFSTGCQQIQNVFRPPSKKLTDHNVPSLWNRHKLLMLSRV